MFEIHATGIALYSYKTSISFTVQYNNARISFLYIFSNAYTLYDVMAHKDRSVQITAYIDEDSDLHEDLQDWRENYNSQSEAVKEAMKRGLDDSSDVDYVLRGLWIGLTVLLALMLGQIGFVAGWTVTGLLVFAVLAVFAVGLNVPFERLLE